jgi:hypothetical protein
MTSAKGHYDLSINVASQANITGVSLFGCTIGDVFESDFYRKPLDFVGCLLVSNVPSVQMVAFYFSSITSVKHRPVGSVGVRAVSTMIVLYGTWVARRRVAATASQRWKHDYVRRVGGETQPCILASPDISSLLLYYVFVRLYYWTDLLRITTIKIDGVSVIIDVLKVCITCASCITGRCAFERAYAQSHSSESGLTSTCKYWWFKQIVANGIFLCSLPMPSRG